MKKLWAVLMTNIEDGRSEWSMECTADGGAAIVLFERKRDAKQYADFQLEAYEAWASAEVIPVAPLKRL